MVLLAFGIGETQIYEAGFAFFNQAYCVFNRHGLSLMRLVGKMRRIVPLGAGEYNFSVFRLPLSAITEAA